MITKLICIDCQKEFEAKSKKAKRCQSCRKLSNYNNSKKAKKRKYDSDPDYRKRKKELAKKWYYENRDIILRKIE